MIHDFGDGMGFKQISLRWSYPVDSMGRYLVISIVLHMVLLAVTLTLVSSKYKFAPPVIIDLTLDCSPVPELHPAEKPTDRIASPRPAVVSPSVPVRRQPERRQPQAQPAPSGNKTVAAAPPALAGSGAANAAVEGSRQAVAILTPSAGIAFRGSQPAGENPVVSSEKAQQRYLKEQFTYIRDKIVKRVTYPPIAQRMGWSGKVSVSFVVDEDGGVRSLQIRESSGYPVLDTCALETIKKCAPFRSPPVAVEIVVPVTFRLQ